MFGKRDTIEVRAPFAFIDGGDIEENEKHREHSCVRSDELFMKQHGLQLLTKQLISEHKSTAEKPWT